jgi:hypothetical protein
MFSCSLFTFFCLDAKESNKEKIKKENLPTGRQGYTALFFRSP